LISQFFTYQIWNTLRVAKRYKAWNFPTWQVWSFHYKPLKFAYSWFPAIHHKRSLLSHIRWPRDPEALLDKYSDKSFPFSNVYFCSWSLNIENLLLCGLQILLISPKRTNQPCRWW
jgi:hypothetical protein